MRARARTLNVAATELTFRTTVVATSIVGYVSGLTFILGAVPPDYFQPAPVIIDEWVFRSAGTLTTGTVKDRVEVFRPGIVLDVHR